EPGLGVGDLGCDHAHLAVELLGPQPEGPEHQQHEGKCPSHHGAQSSSIRSRSARATSVLGINGSGRGSLPGASRVTRLVSYPKPAPASAVVFSTSRSTFLRASLAWAWASALAVSKAKPTTTCPGRFRAPSPARMSSVGSSSITGGPCSFLIFSPAAALGRKSA